MSLIVTPRNTNLCTAGSPVTLTVTGGSNYVWNTGQTGDTITVHPTTTTLYTVKGVDALDNPVSGKAMVTVYTPPIVAVTPASPVISAGQAVALNFSYTQKNQLYALASWQISPNDSTVVYTHQMTNPIGSSGSYAIVQPLATTTYTVTAVSVNGCVGTETVTVTVQ